MMKSKVISSSTPPAFTGGHGNHMLGKTSAKPQVPGTTIGSAPRGPSGTYASGGSAHMVGPQKSTPAKAH